MDSVQKVYAALGIRHDEDGKKITDTSMSFIKPLHEMSDRRLRLLMHMLWPPLKTVLNSFHNDTAGLLRLLASKVETDNSKSAQQTILTSALADLPLVKDILRELDLATDAHEERRLLSLLTQSFSRNDLNKLGLQKTISQNRCE